MYNHNLLHSLTPPLIFSSLLTHHLPPLSTHSNPLLPSQTPITLSNPLLPSETPPGAAAGHDGGIAGGRDLDKGGVDLSNEQTVIPNLAAYITINPSLQFFAANPNQRRIVSLAVDRAIREIIQPVVERSVTIASVTTKQILLKGTQTH